MSQIEISAWNVLAWDRCDAQDLAIIKMLNLCLSEERANNSESQQTLSSHFYSNVEAKKKTPKTLHVFKTLYLATYCKSQIKIETAWGIKHYVVMLYKN